MHLHIPHVLYKTGGKEFFQLSVTCMYTKKYFFPLKATKNEKIQRLLHKQGAM